MDVLGILDRFLESLQGRITNFWCWRQNTILVCLGWLVINAGFEAQWIVARRACAFLQRGRLDDLQDPGSPTSSTINWPHWLSKQAENKKIPPATLTCFASLPFRHEPNANLLWPWLSPPAVLLIKGFHHFPHCLHEDWEMEVFYFHPSNCPPSPHKKCSPPNAPCEKFFAVFVTAN